MPSSTVKQAKVMSAIAHGWHPSKGSVAKIPKKVAVDFHKADAGHKYGKGMPKKASGGKVALHIARKYAKRASGGKVKKLADGGSSDDEQTPEAPPKRLIMNMSPERPEGSPELTAALTKTSPLEGEVPPAPSLTATHETPRNTIRNFLAGPDTKSYEPRAVLADKAMGLLDWTPPMMAEQAGEDIAKGEYQNAAMFAMPGAKKAKGAFGLDKLVTASANYAMQEAAGPGQKAIANGLKANYGKDIAKEVIKQNLEPWQIENLSSYLSAPGMPPKALKNFEDHYFKLAPKQEPSFAPALWNTPEIQATKPNLTVVPPSPDPNKSFGIPSSQFHDESKLYDPYEKWGHYDALHDKISQQYMGLTNAEKSAVAYWGDPAGYKDLNGHLRGATSSEKAEATIPYLDSAIAVSPLPQTSIMWRGLHGPHAEELKKLGAGDTFWNAGYTATTIDPRRATHYGLKNDPGIILNYHLPEGFPALYTSHPDAGGWSQSEREFLLPHGVPFRILGTEKIKAPVWDYTGSVKDKNPHEFIVYHVAPADEAVGAKQLDAVAGAKPKQSLDQYLKTHDISDWHNAPFTPKGKDTDIEDYYAHQEKHEAGPEWNPEVDDIPGHYEPHDPNDISPYHAYQSGKINQTQYLTEMQNHMRPSDWLAFRPKDVPLENLPKIDWGKNNPEKLEKELGINIHTPIFKGGFYDSDTFVPGGYPKELVDPAKYKNSEQAWFAATNPGIAQAYHGGENLGGMYVARAPKFFEFDWDKFFGSHNYLDGDMHRVIERAKNLGADVIAIHGMKDVGSGKHGVHTQLAFLNTHVLRAPTANFDPTKLHLRHPLAGIAGGGIFAYGTLGGEPEHKAEGGRVKVEKVLPDDHKLGMKVPKGGSMCANCKYLASPTTCGNKGYIEWHGKAELPEPADEYCCDLYEHSKPETKAEGGKVAKKEKDPEDHEYIHFAKGGLIDSDIPGRTDKIPMKVAAGSYVLPADIPSALGQNNTKAGSEVLKKMFSSAPYGLAPMKMKSQGHHFDKMTTPKVTSPFADGGKTDDHVPIIAAGGEYVIHPEVVKAIGNGDMNAGHAILDKFVLHTRAQHIKALKKLKPPKA